MPFAKCIAFATIILATGTASAFAQGQGDRLAFGVGTIVAPEFPGSASYDVTPIPFVNFSYDLGPATVRTKGLAIVADVLDGPAMAAGPILRYSFGRTPGDISNPAVAALPGVDGTLEGGVFAELRLPIGQSRATRFRADLEVVQGITGGHDGLLAEGGLGLERRFGPLLVSGALTATWANNTYTDTFFGVDAAGAGASGLPVFDPGAGIRDLGVELTTVLPVTDRVVVNAVIGYSELQGDAANSPIVEDRGQFFVLAGLGYRF